MKTSKKRKASVSAASPIAVKAEKIASVKIEPEIVKPQPELENAASNDSMVMDADDADDEEDCVEEKSSFIKAEWKSEDHVTLFNQIQAAMPPDDNVKYSTMADKLDWSKVKVQGYSANECKEEWQRISTKLRRFRTMSELLVDAKSWAKHPWNTFGKKMVKHPDMPKKPLTPYFRFFMTKRERYSTKHPAMTATDLTKALSKKYANLSEKKKQKYIDSFNKEMSDWRGAMETFRVVHPDLFDEDDKGPLNTAPTKHSAESGPPKTITAMQLYINEKCLEEQAKKSPLTRKQLYENYRNLWSKLTDVKKMPYITKAIEAKQQYDSDMTRYRERFPDYRPRIVKTFLSKAEQKIKDRHDGKPEKPPGNGYSLFTVETLPLLTDLANIERLGEVSRRWKKLSEEKREAYNLKAEERNQDYRVRYDKYLQNLSPDARQKLMEEDNEKLFGRKKLVPPSTAILNGSAAAEKRTKPVAAVFIFIEDHKNEYKRLHPDMDDNEIQRQLVKDFNCLEEKDKAKYKQLEEKAKERLAQESSQAVVISTQKKAKRMTFPGEPPLPPHSGYQLFSKELLLQLKDVKSSERLQEIGKRWAMLSDTEKQRHNRRKDILWAQYRKDVEKFKKTLSAKDIKRFEDLHRPAKSKKKKKDKEEFPADDLSSADEVNGSASSDDEKDSVASAGGSNSLSTASSEDSSSSSSDEDGSDSDPEEATVEQLLENSATIQALQVKTGKLSATDIYGASDDASSDDSLSQSSYDST